ncbi:MAG TPA: TonB-dependent receptor [Blastocatellia bacterium]|nr:TonB-dependent receptor [Blastocatellia bacterium]
MTGLLRELRGWTPNMGLMAGLLLLLFSLAPTANAQFRAGIQGAVTDPQGAAVVGATVTLTSKETNRTQQTTTGDEGFYRFDRLAPGNYEITVEASGFKKQVLENVVVSAEEVQGINIQLETGEIAETVTVTTDVAAQLQTENPNVGGSITEREIQRLPQIGRDPYELIRLTPGVFGLGARSATGDSVRLPNQVGPGGSNNSIFQTENQVPISANGQRVEANNFQIDGVSAMSQAWGGAAVVTPNQESVKEIRVLANNYTAEYGRNTGAQVLVVSQSGTNDFHGSLFFKRNTPGLNAFQDIGRSGTALRPSEPQRVNQLLSQYGGSVGGPILKDRLFFFFSYETIRRSSAREEPFWIETPEFVSLVGARRPNSIANRVLQFPGMTPSRVASVRNVDCAFLGINDPTRCRVVSGGLDIGSPTGTIGQAVDSIGGGLDNIPDIRFANLILTSRNKSEQYNARIDYQVTQNDLVAFSMYFTPNTTNSNDNGWGDRARPGLDFESGRRNSVGMLTWTRTLSPTMINEARFNVTRWYFDEVASNPNVGYGIPQINICCNPDVTFGSHTGPGVFYQNTYNFRDTLSKVVNAHGLKFGVDIIAEQNNDRAPWAGRPTFEFGNLWSFANDAPNIHRAFFDPATGAFADLAAYARSKYYALFAQDDWKVRPNLTLNLGLRWEYFTPLRSKRDRISNLVLGPGGSLLGASIQVGGDLFEPDRNNFGPQIGFAWSPRTVIGRDIENRAVVRGGFGIGYNRLPGSRLLESRFNPPFFAEFSFDRASGNILYATASDLNSLAFPPNPAARLTFDPATGMPISGPPVGINAVPQEMPNSYAYRYSLSVEYDVGYDWIASLAYQGSAAHKLPRIVPYHLFTTPNPRIRNVNLLLPDVNSNFNALLVGAQRRFSRGFLFNAEYRWAKSLDTCSNDHDCRQTYPFDQSTEYGPSDFDVRHSFRAFGNWALPIFRDRRDVLGTVAGGWELSGILTASTGFPWTPVVGGAACNAVVAGGGVCPLRPIAQIRGPATDSTSNDTFLGAGQFPGGGLLYFVPPPTGSFTVPPRPGVGRNSLRGPGYFSVDMTAVKRFGFPTMPVLGENAGIEIKVNAYNLFNRLNLEPFQANADNTQIQHVDFGRAIRALSGRVVEFQARFSF